MVTKSREQANTPDHKELASLTFAFNCQNRDVSAASVDQMDLSSVFMLVRHQLREVSQFSTQMFVNDLKLAQMEISHMQLPWIRGMRQSLINPEKEFAAIMKVIEELPVGTVNQKPLLSDYLVTVSKALGKDKFNYLELMLRITNDHHRALDDNIRNPLERQARQRDPYSTANRYNHYAHLIHVIKSGEEVETGTSSMQRRRSPVIFDS